MSTLASGNFDRIWLEPREGADIYIGRQWCQDNQWGDEGVEYVRADLVPAPGDQMAVSDDADRLEDLRLAATAIRTYMPDTLPAGEDGKIHFARALAEAATAVAE